ncbi:hypothetical protein EMIT053CA3_60148 [Pseudomonas donghuensis]
MNIALISARARSSLTCLSIGWLVTAQPLMANAKTLTPSNLWLFFILGPPPGTARS